MPLVHKLLTPHAIVAATGLVCLVSAGVFYAEINRQPQSSYASVRSGPLVEEVDTTGTVKAAESVDLAFQVGGKVASAGPAVGTRVAAGRVLATLSGGDQEAAVEQAKAALQVQEANLASLRVGARAEDLAVAQSSVSGAHTAVTQDKQAIIQAAQDAYEKSDDAIHNKVDQFFSNPRSSSPTLLLPFNDTQLQTSVTSGRLATEMLLSTWQSSLAALSSDPDQVDIGALASTTRDNLNSVNTYLNMVAQGLTTVIPTTQYPQATVLTYQSNVASARSAVSADIASINTAQASERAAEAALATDQSQYSLKQAPATAESIAAQEAEVAVAQAALDAANAQLGKTVITAPIAGTITINNAHVGEIAAPGAPLLSLISDSQFQFETYVSETDLAKLKVGQAAQVELDAYESAEPFSAHVVSIDPAATVQNGISAYKVTLQFDTNDSRIQTGLTGSIKVTTQSIASAISVPASAIITRGTDHFVLRKGAGGDEESKVEIGITTPDGFTQILSGLLPGDEVRSFGGTQ